ncbi:alanine racemase [Sphingosinicella rhizophila]|uniref:Alanine racemase n=1 Tax=Sphingosinicella rhizophila TaxID=3050082 RepID=A0ABU3Q6C5_9SPHN|nr:alanine racemase [Sphingosinicella sp. GR2756]MDT9598480.1 alanine racemase [Sphingosinicella sp. GR2756]
MTKESLVLRDPFDQNPLDWTHKGIPPVAEGLSRAAIRDLNLHLFTDDFLFPTAVLQQPILEANSRWMMNFLRRFGADFAPHGKTTMSPDLMNMQLRDGAWGLTAATVHHVRAYRRWGIRRIILANQLIGDGETRWIARELLDDADFDFYCLVDSAEAARNIAACLRQQGLKRPLNLLLEVGAKGGRAGVRSVDQGMEVAAAVAGLPELALRGVETFEGLFQTAPDGDQRARRMLDMVVALAGRCVQDTLFAPGEILLTGGGSGLFDLATEILANHDVGRTVRVVIRSGCYLVHDDGMYKMLFEKLRRRIGPCPELEGGLKSALQVWARVQSKPEPGRMICALGKRDIGEDCGPPMLVGRLKRGDQIVQPPPPGHVVTGLNDQHAYVEGPCEDFAIGDLVAFGVSHPCTTFDKWRSLLVVDGDHRVIDVIRTYF